MRPSGPRALTAAVHQVLDDREATLRGMADLVAAAAADGDQLIVFAEAAPTGFVAGDDVEQAVELTEPIPGPATDTWVTLARRHHVWLAAGLYENAGSSDAPRLYDAAVLIDPAGSIVLHFRRNTPQWHGPSADPAVFGQGATIPTAETPFGRVGMLLCGDLFDDAVTARAAVLDLDVLLVPLARGFDSEVADAGAWRSEERFVYADRARAVGATHTVLVNHLDLRAPHPTFGGALVVAGDGQILAEQTIQTVGIASVEMPALRPRPAVPTARV